MCDRVVHPEEPVWSEADASVDLQEGSEFNEISLTSVQTVLNVLHSGLQLSSGKLKQ